MWWEWDDPLSRGPTTPHDSTATTSTTPSPWCWWVMATTLVHVISTLVTVLDHVTTILRHDGNVTTVLDHAVLGHVTVTRLTCYYLLQCSPTRTTPLKSYVCLPQKWKGTHTQLWIASFGGNEASSLPWLIYCTHQLKYYNNSVICCRATVHILSTLIQDCVGMNVDNALTAFILYPWELCYKLHSAVW